MSTSERDNGEIVDGRGEVRVEAPPPDRFVELEVFSDDMLEEKPELTVMYDGDNMDRWIRCESWFVVDLEEVQ